MAVLEELAEGGAWRRLAAKPTKSEAGDTPGLGVLGPMGSRKGTHGLDELLFADACARSGGGCGLKALPEGARDAAMRLVPLADESDEAVFFPSGRGGVLFKRVFGDTGHAAPPVILCDKDCSRSTALDVKEPQLLIWPRGPYVLIATEYDGARPRLYEPPEAAPVWSSESGESAVWLPFDGSRL